MIVNRRWRWSCETGRPTCIVEGTPGAQRCTPEHSRTACRVLYTHMSSTAFRNHCLKMIITNIRLSSIAVRIFFCHVKKIYWSHMNQFFQRQVLFKRFMISLILWRKKCASLTLSSCEHQEKHKENQAQSLHVWATKAFRNCCGQADPAFILHLNQGGGVFCARSIITSLVEWGQSEGLRSGLFMHLIYNFL